MIYIWAGDVLLGVCASAEGECDGATQCKVNKRFPLECNGLFSELWGEILGKFN